MVRPCIVSSNMQPSMTLLRILFDLYIFVSDVYFILRLETKSKDLVLSSPK